MSACCSRRTGVRNSQGILRRLVNKRSLEWWGEIKERRVVRRVKEDWIRETHSNRFLEWEGTKEIECFEGKFCLSLRGLLVIIMKTDLQSIQWKLRF